MFKDHFKTSLKNTVLHTLSNVFLVLKVGMMEFQYIKAEQKFGKTDTTELQIYFFFFLFFQQSQQCLYCLVQDIAVYHFMISHIQFTHTTI